MTDCGSHVKVNGKGATPTDLDASDSKMNLTGFPISITKTDGGNSDVSTYDTVQKMIQIVKDNSKLPLVKEYAYHILQTSDGSTQDKLDTLYNWVKGKITFKNDEDLLAGLMGLPPDKELLLTPHFILNSDNVQGDCDDFSTLLACLIVASEIPVDVYFVTICADKNEPDRWSHVYVAVKGCCGKVIPMDASHGPYMGWETSTAIKKKYWLVNKGRNDMVRSLGSTDYGPDIWGNTPPTDTSYSSSGIDWGNILNTSVSSGLDILKTVVAQPKPGQYIMTGPGGQTVNYQLPVGAPASAMTFPNLFGAGGSSGILLLGGALLLMVVLMKS